MAGFTNHPNACLTIAGFDPSGGAGLVADIKTFTKVGVYGYSVCTAITYQNASEILGVEWLKLESVLRQLEALDREGLPHFVKIGIVENFAILEQIVSFLYQRGCFILLDPIIKSSSGYQFWQDVPQATLLQILPKISLLTPNFAEYQMINQILDTEVTKFTDCYVKSFDEVGKDMLFVNSQATEITDDYYQKDLPPKHGSGCVFSSMILANLCLGETLVASCESAKRQISQFLSSNGGLLGVL